MPITLKISSKIKEKTLADLDKLETIFFEVLEDLKDYHDDLTLVGGWLSYVYSRFLWNNLRVNPVTTADIDFGIGGGEQKVYSKTIFQILSNRDYTERHPKMDRMYPVVLYKEGTVRIDFITFPEMSEETIEKFVGSQININRIEKFEFILKNRIKVEVKDIKRKKSYVLNCPRPSAYVYHKLATFVSRENEQKKAKDLFYVYFMLRHAPDVENILKEAGQYYKAGHFKEVPANLKKYFERKSSQGCLMVEKENGPDAFIADVRQDIYERFSGLALRLCE